MKYELKTNYRGRFHSMPNILLDFLPSDTYMTFAQIYVAGRKPLCDNRINMSQRVLSKRTGLGWRKISKSISELQQLGFVRVVSNERKASMFQIDWEEIYMLEEFAKTLSYDGVAELSAKCLTEPITPFSQLKRSYLQKIKSEYPFDYEEYKSETSNTGDDELENDTNVLASATILNKIDEMVADEMQAQTPTATILNKIAKMVADELSPNSATATICAKSVEMVADENIYENQSATILNKNAKMGADWQNTQPSSATISANYTKMVADENKNCSHYFSKIQNQFAINILLSYTESLLVDAVGVDNLNVIFKTCQNGSSLCHVQNPSAPILNKNAKMVADENLCENQSATISANYTKMVADEESCLNPSATISYKNAKMVADDPKSATPTCQNGSRVIYNNKYNKNNHSERSSLNIGEEKKKEKENPEGNVEVLEQDELVQTSSDFSKKNNKPSWVEFRDLSLPSFSEYEVQKIMDNPRYYDSDSDKLIRSVLEDLQGNDEEDEQGEPEWENSQDEIQNKNIVPVEHFQKILYNVWSDLKEADENFSISEEQAKNIFGFDVVELGDEFGFVISTSKIKKIEAVGELPERRSKKKIRASRNDRQSFMCFKDAVDEISYNSVNDLTPAEYVIVCIDELAASQKEKGIPRPDTIAKGIFSDYLVKWSEEAGMSLDDMKELVKELPLRGNMITLSPQRISVEKIFNYNHAHGDESKVEPLWKSKLADMKANKVNDSVEEPSATLKETSTNLPASGQSHDEEQAEMKMAN